MRLMDMQKHSYGTMTNEEKKINKLDLINYKQKNDYHNEAMIPGIHNLNTVGTSPLKRGAKQIVGGRNLTSDGPDGRSPGLGGSQSMKILPNYQTQT